MGAIKFYWYFSFFCWIVRVLLLVFNGLFKVFFLLVVGVKVVAEGDYVRLYGLF